MRIANNILLKALGILLLTGAVLKGWQLLTEPVANSDIWTNRAFLIFTVEFEIALGIWLLSGLFKKAAWLVALLKDGTVTSAWEAKAPGFDEIIKNIENFINISPVNSL